MTAATEPTVPDLPARDTNYRDKRVARFAALAAIAASAAPLAPIARPPWLAARGSAALAAYHALDYLDALAGLVARDSGTSPSEIEEVLGDGMPLLSPDVAPAVEAYLVTLRAD